MLDLTAQYNAILSTCHLSVPEIQKLVATARERGVEKIMITHPFFKVPALDLEDLKALVAQGAYAEFGYCTVSPMWNHAPLTRVVEAIKELGSRALHPHERRRPAPQPDAGRVPARLRPVRV